MIVSNYLKLFSIEFRHEAYYDRADILRDITVTPEEETIQIMNGSRMFYKIDRNTLFCFVQTIASVAIQSGTVKVTTINKPLLNIDETTQLSFKIIVNSGQFLNNSTLRLLDSKNKIFRLCNDSGNKQNGSLYLSRDFPYVNIKDLVNDDEKKNCFAVLNISFEKNLANGFSLLA